MWLRNTKSQHVAKNNKVENHKNETEMKDTAKTVQGSPVSANGPNDVYFLSYDVRTYYMETGKDSGNSNLTMFRSQRSRNIYLQTCNFIDLRAIFYLSHCIC